MYNSTVSEPLDEKLKYTAINVCQTETPDEQVSKYTHFDTKDYGIPNTGK